MNHIVGSHGRAVIELIVFIQVKDPGGGIFHFPTLGQTALEVALLIIVGAKRAGDLAPNSVQKRDAVAIGIGGFDGFGNADGDPRLGVCDYVVAQ